MKFPAIAKKTDTLMTQLGGYYSVPGAVITAASLGRLADTLGAKLKVDSNKVRHSISCIEGLPAEYQTIHDAVYFLAANKELFAENPPIYKNPRFIVHNAEVQFGSVLMSSDRMNATCNVTVLTGEHSLSKFDLTQPVSYWYSWLTRLGYSYSRSSSYWLSSLMTSLPSLYGHLQITPQNHRTRRLTDCIVELIDDASAIAYNRKHILSYRRGVKECPFGFEEEKTSHPHFCCLLCTVSTQDCKASRCSDDYAAGVCRVCGCSTELIHTSAGLCRKCISRSVEDE